MRSTALSLVALFLFSCAAPVDPGTDGSAPDAHACGDGVVSLGERCDVAIASGAGACVTECASDDACTESVVEGAGTCAAQCVERPRAVGAVDDCCPPGATHDDDADCAPTCGNGVFDLDEFCDTAISTGEGACPTSCTASSVCLTSSLSGAGTCDARCVDRAITARVSGDGCCPSGATMLDDDDCVPSCGNGAIESGEACDDGNRVDADACDSRCQIVCGDGTVQSFERCDVAIASGEGTCPSACVPPEACQLGALSGTGCGAYCRFTTRTTSTSGDGCCLPGGFSERDADCPTSSCGNGIVESWERCDTAITSGSAACPTTCDDANACTVDVFEAPGTCTARCTRTTITARVAGDGCCPSGADSRTDADCVPRLRCEARTRVTSLLSDEGRSVVLGTDRGGALIAAWIEHDTTSSDAVRWSRRDPTTGSWSAERSVELLAGDDALDLRLAHDANGDVVLAWIERTSIADDVDWSRLDAATDTWSSEASIDGLVSDEAAELVLTTESSGALVAAWVERSTSADRIQWSRLDLATDTWSTEAAIDGLVSDDAAELRLVRDAAGALLALWVERRSSSDRVEWSRLDAATDVWSSEAAVDGLVSDDATSLRVTTGSSGALVAIWNERHVGSSDAVEWSRLDSATRTWSTEVDVDGLVSDDVTDVAFTHDADASLVVGWIEHRSGSSDRVEWGRLDETTDRFTVEASIDGLVSEDASIVRLHLHPSGALMSFYVKVDPSFGALEWSQLDRTTRRWTSERSITSLRSISELALLDVGSETHVVWIEETSSSFSAVESGVCGVW